MIFQLGILNFTNFKGKHLSWILFSKIILKRELFFAILKPLMLMNEFFTRKRHHRQLHIRSYIFDGFVKILVSNKTKFGQILEQLY